MQRRHEREKKKKKYKQNKCCDHKCEMHFWHKFHRTGEWEKKMMKNAKNKLTHEKKTSKTSVGQWLEWQLWSPSSSSSSSFVVVAVAIAVAVVVIVIIAAAFIVCSLSGYWYRMNLQFTSKPKIMNVRASAGARAHDELHLYSLLSVRFVHLTAIAFRITKSRNGTRRQPNRLY